MEKELSTRISALGNIIALHEDVATKAVVVLDQGWTAAIVDCTMQGLSVLTPNLHLSAHLVLQTIASMGKSMIVTSREIWSSIKSSCGAMIERLEQLNVVLF